jgi:hypothetical protein
MSEAAATHPSRSRHLDARERGGSAIQRGDVTIATSASRSRHVVMPPLLIRSLAGLPYAVGLLPGFGRLPAYLRKRPANAKLNAA